MPSSCQSRGHKLIFQPMWRVCCFFLWFVFEPPHDKTNKMTVCPAKTQPGDSDQTGRMQRLWSDWVDAQGDLSLRWAQMSFCWFCHEATHLSINIKKGLHGWVVTASSYRSLCCRFKPYSRQDSWQTRPKLHFTAHHSHLITVTLPLSVVTLSLSWHNWNTIEQGKYHPRSGQVFISKYTSTSAPAFNTDNVPASLVPVWNSDILWYFLIPQIWWLLVVLPTVKIFCWL